MPRELDNLDDIRKIATDLLRRADVDDVLPTPVDRLVEVSGLEQSGDWTLTESKIAQAPKEIRKLLRSAARKIVGTLDRREKVIYIAPEVQGTAKGKFVQLHETMHHEMDWQRDLLVLADSNRELAPSVQQRFEQEANQGAAELMFQVDFFDRLARDYPTDISTPITLASLMGASIHSSIRRWVEGHPGAVAVVVLESEPVSTFQAKLQRQYVTQSPTWQTRIGPTPFRAVMSQAVMPFLADLVDPWAGDIDTDWTVPGRDGEARSVRVQSFNNGYNTFLLLWQPRRESFVARHRRRSTIVI